ncbi:hypothetical protein E4U53_001753, partial [Claviceps sorghi]
MVTKSRLRMALAAEKGIDFKKLKQQKKHKESLKRKNSKSQPAPQEDTDDEVEDESHHQSSNDLEQGIEDQDESRDQNLNFGAVDETDTSDSEIEMEAKIERRTANQNSKAASKKLNQAGEDQEDEDEEEDQEDQEDIPVSDLEDLDDEDKEDLIPHTRLTINNTSALQTALDRISIPGDQRATFASHQSVSSSSKTAESIPDVSDDLQRELAFYSQCLEAARIGRAKLLAEGVPFSRPKDYFAEMIKEDAHMEKVKAKLIEEASAKKASAEARKLRDLKKFGKQVQVAKLQERQKAKRETLEKIKSLKR